MCNILFPSVYWIIFHTSLTTSQNKTIWFCFWLTPLQLWTHYMVIMNELNMSLLQFSWHKKFNEVSYWFTCPSKVAVTRFFKRSLIKQLPTAAAAYSPISKASPFLMLLLISWKNNAKVHLLKIGNYCLINISNIWLLFNRCTI